MVADVRLGALGADSFVRAVHQRVPLSGNCLAYKKIALLVTGGIAAFKAPLLARELRRYGAEVTVFASHEALRYVTDDALAWSSNQQVIQALLQVLLLLIQKQQKVHPNPLLFLVQTALQRIQQIL